MKKIFLTIFLLFNVCLFSHGQDVQNPLIAGDFPDPSILVDEGTYYMVHSSFEYYPGLTIWSSEDMEHWQPEQSPLKKYVGSVWAPDFVKCNGKYYIYFPADTTNYVIWADKIDGTWSEPIDLHIGGIDPGHVVDKKGRRYLYFSNGGYIQLEKNGLKTVGDYKHVYDGWEIPRDWSIECFCMEGPKLTKHGDYYYLTVAEGGTAGPPTGHMVVSARSKSPLGPWENSPYNPILRSQSAKQHWCSIGHATPFADADGNWWMVFHGYEKNYYNMGRQTCLAPIEWTPDGWWKLPDSFSMERSFEISKTEKMAKDSFSLSDDFSGNVLRPHWRFWRDFDEKRFAVADNCLIMNAKGTDIVSSCPLLVTPQHHSYSTSVEVLIEGNAVGGLLLFYSSKAYSGILADSANVLSNLRGWQFVTENGVHAKRVFLKLENHENVVDMYYSFDAKTWIKTSNSFDITGYHHNVLGDFLAVRIALVSMGEGKVKFRNFEYSPLYE